MIKKIINIITIFCFLILIGCDSDSTETDSEESNLSSNSGVELSSTILLKNIPGGSFTMGGTPETGPSTGDSPEVTITISSFQMSETEITNRQYIDFLNAAFKDGWVIVESMEARDPCGTYTENMVVGTADSPYAGKIFLQLGETGGCTSNGEEEHIDNKSWITFNTADEIFELSDAEKADWPANWVKWFGAHAFTEYYCVSLPSEAQWEFAAKGGRNYNFPTDDGELNSDKANYNGDSPGVYNPDGHVIKTGSYLPNPYGLYDMGGNVWEWCIDYYDAGFYTDGAIDPLNAVAGSDVFRVRRGGSWNYHSATLLTYARASDFEDRGNNHFGFRIVKN